MENREAFDFDGSPKTFIVHNEGITSVEVDRLKTLKSLQAPLDCFVE